MLDIQILVEADESYRSPLITVLTGSDRSWSFINNKPGGNPDQKEIRIGLQIKLALLSLVQDYRRAQEITAGLVDLARRSPELSKFVSDQLDTSLVSSPRTALRMIARSAVQSLNAGNSVPHSATEQRKGVPPVFIVAADESQQREGEKLAEALRESGINAQGVDVVGATEDAKLIAPESLEIRFSEGTNDESVLTGLAEKVKRQARNQSWSASRWITIQEPTRFGFPSPEQSRCRF